MAARSAGRIRTTPHTVTPMPLALLLAALACPATHLSGVECPDDRIEQIQRLLEGHSEYRAFSGAVAVAEGAVVGAMGSAPEAS